MSIEFSKNVNPVTECFRELFNNIKVSLIMNLIMRHERCAVHGTKPGINQITYNLSSPYSSGFMHAVITTTAKGIPTMLQR